MVHGYLTAREFNRAILAKWWGTLPTNLRRLPMRELRLMAEFKSRSDKAGEDAVQTAQYGPPTPGRDTNPSEDGW